MSVEGPLYAFTLPPPLLESLQLRQGPLLAPTETDRNPQQELQPDAGGEASTSLGCSLCKVASFQSVANQRLHFRSDWHRYNLRLASVGSSKKQIAPLTEEQFRARAEAEDLDDNSISGSESSSSSDSSTSSSATSSEAQEDPGQQAATLQARKTPLAWFVAPGYEPGAQFGIYRAAIPSVQPKSLAPPQGWTEALRQQQVTPHVPLNKKDKAALPEVAAPENGCATTPFEHRSWAVFMIGGGHFAAAVLSLVPKITKQSGKFEREVEVLAHKTIHRYTTRRKQGGAQSSNDQSKSKAKSAGAQIRRYNEQALQDDIRALLEDWSELLQATDLVFMRASKNNSKIFFNYDGSPLSRSDSRLRTIPFPTRRPTLAEVHRVFGELTRVKVSHLSDEALAKLDEDFLAEQLTKKARLAKPRKQQQQQSDKDEQLKVPSLSPEESLLRKRWLRLVEMVAKGRIDALLSFVDKRSEDEPDVVFTGDLPDWLPESELSPNVLHLASASGQPEVVRWLLLDHRADPTILNRAKKTPYEAAATRATRNVFRRCMHDQPQLCDWQGAARVPSGLTEEVEQEQKDKNKERKNKLRDRARERDAAAQAEETKRREESAAAEERKAAEARQKLLSQPSKGPSRLGGAGAAFQKARAEQQMAGLSEQDKMRVERERRARAAEARLAGRS